MCSSCRNSNTFESSSDVGFFSPSFVQTEVDADRTSFWRLPLLSYYPAFPHISSETWASWCLALLPSIWLHGIKLHGGWFLADFCGSGDAGFLGGTAIMLSTNYIYLWACHPRHQDQTQNSFATEHGGRSAGPILFYFQHGPPWGQLLPDHLMKNTEFSWQLASPDQLSCMEMNECSSLSRKKNRGLLSKERERES